MAQNWKGPGQLLSAGRSHLGLLVLLVIYLSVTLIYSQLYPLGEAPDENAHMELIRFIGEQGHLPRSNTEREAAGYKSDWPMLYHILVGTATGWIDYDVLPRLKANDFSPNRLLVNDGLSPFAMIHTDDEAPPYRGITLAWRLARLASALFSLGTLVVVYIIVLNIRPGDRWLALGTTAVVAAIPRFHFMASAANDDNLLGLFAALFTLTLMKAWQRPEGRWIYAWLGVWLGLAVTTKYSVILLPLLVLVVLAYSVVRNRLGWRAAISRLLIFGVSVVVTAAWWFIYIEWYFNEIQERGLIPGLIRPLLFDQSTQRVSTFLTGQAGATGTAIASRPTVWDWARTIFSSFWFVPGQANPGIVTVISLLFAGVCLLALTGLWRAWRRRYPVPWPLLGVLALQIGLLIPLPLLRFLLNFNTAESGQGRHVLFPAAAAVGLLLVVGVCAWFPPDRNYAAGPALAGTLLVISLVSFVGFVLPAFPPRLPVRASTDAAQNVPNPVNMPLGDEIELISYQVGEVNEHGVLPVILIWHSQANAERDYLVELSLLDNSGQLRSLSLSHPVDGRYPTRAWEPGDVVRDTNWLPVINLEPGSYQLRLRLLPDNSSDPTSNNESEILLGSVEIPALPAHSATRSLELPGGQPVGFDVWQAGQPTVDKPVYNYRAAIPITFPQPHAEISLVGPGGTQQTPIAQAGDTYTFLVGATWPSGDYALRVQEAGETIDSNPIMRIQVRPRNFDVPPMSTEVHANFGDEIMLLGYDFPERRTQPGGALPVTLTWQALRPVSQHYTVANHLLNSADLRQWGGSDRVPQDYYSTALWTPGEVVRDEYLVTVDPSAPPGVYRLDIGLYVELAGQSWHLPLVQNGSALESNSVTIGPIKVGGPPAGITVQAPSPQHGRADNLEDKIRLLGYDLSREPETLHLTLYWRSETPVAADYTTFVHVRDSTGQATGQPGTIVAQMDRPPAGGAYPTSLWDRGEVIRDSIEIPIPAQVPAGEYEIIVGLYELATGRRLVVFNDQGEPIGDHIRLDEELTAP